MDPNFVRGVELAVIAAAAFACLAAIVSGLYIWLVYDQRDREDSRDALFLTRLVIRDLRVAVCGAIILGYLALSTAGLGLGRPWGAIIVGVPVIILLYGPTSDALLWRRERAKYRADVVAHMVDDDDPV